MDLAAFVSKFFIHIFSNCFLGAKKVSDAQFETTLWISSWIWFKNIFKYVYMYLLRDEFLAWSPRLHLSQQRLVCSEINAFISASFCIFTNSGSIWAIFWMAAAACCCRGSIIEFLNHFFITQRETESTFGHFCGAKIYQRVSTRKLERADSGSGRFQIGYRMKRFEEIPYLLFSPLYLNFSIVCEVEVRD